MAGSEKKLVKAKSGYRMVPVIDTNASPFTISEPAWVPDTQVQPLQIHDMSKMLQKSNISTSIFSL